MASLCYKRDGQLENAGRLADRLHIREPENLKYLLNLIDIKIAVGETEDARELLRKARRLEHDNKNLRKLIKALRKKIRSQT